jgi:tellurite resistance protein TerC
VAGEVIGWGVFTSSIVGMLAVDMVLLSRRGRAIGVRAALLWSLMWVSVALAFGVGVFAFLGSAKGVEYLTGYVIEKSLSVDNLFVFLVVFQYFAVPPALQARGLTWGIIGALIMRLVFILVGAALLQAFDWMVFVFGGFLVLTALRLATQKEHDLEPERNPLLRLLRSRIPITPEYREASLFARVRGRLHATPFLVVLLVIASTDVVFAIDSIPAIFAVTRDPFIVYSSNAFAILGMRALYFALAGVLGLFAYLRQGLVGVLAFVGVKMLLSEWYHLPTFVSLAVILGILSLAVAASMVAGRRRPDAAGEPVAAAAGGESRSS